MFKAMIAGAALLAAPTAASAPDFGGTINLCRVMFVEKLKAGQVVEAKKRYEALDSAGRAYADQICSAYFIGQQDFIDTWRSMGSPRDAVAI